MNNLDKFLEEKQYRAKNLPISSKVLMNWKSKGLLFQMINNKWHQFNFIEICWFNLVYKLRSFGLPVKYIQSIKKVFENDISLKEVVKEILVNKSNAILTYYYEDVISIFINGNQYFSNSDQITSSFLNISLTDILFDLIKNKDFSSILNNILDNNEIELINLILDKENSISSITIVSNKGYYNLNSENLDLDTIFEIFFMGNYISTTYEIKDKNGNKKKIIFDK